MAIVSVASAFIDLYKYKIEIAIQVYQIRSIEWYISCFEFRSNLVVSTFVQLAPLAVNSNIFYRFVIPCNRIQTVNTPGKNFYFLNYVILENDTKGMITPSRSDSPGKHMISVLHCTFYMSLG